LRRRAHFDIGGNGIAPFVRIGLGRLHQFGECLGVKSRIGGRAHRAFAFRRGGAGWIVGETAEHVPAGAVFVVQAKCRREIVDARFALVGAVAVLAQPEEALVDHKLCKRSAVLALRRFADLLAKILKGWIRNRARRRYRNHLVGSRFGRRRWQITRPRL